VCERVCPAPFGCGSCVILTVAVVSVLLQWGPCLALQMGCFRICTAGVAAVWRQRFWSGQAASALTRARFCMMF